MIIKLIKLLPPQIVSILRYLHFDHFLARFLGKETIALAYQTNFVRQFNQEKLLSYWKQYRFLDEINAIINIQPTAKILDVGCGVPTVLHLLGGEKYGIDPLAEEYQKIYNYPKDIKIKKGTGEQIMFSNEFFDVVFCSNALDHVANPQDTVREVWRVLKPGGYFVLTVERFEKTKKEIKPILMRFFWLISIIYFLIHIPPFEILMEKEYPFCGERHYGPNRELTMVLKKI